MHLFVLGIFEHIGLDSWPSVKTRNSHEFGRFISREDGKTEIGAARSPNAFDNQIEIRRTRPTFCGGGNGLGHTFVFLSFSTSLFFEELVSLEEPQ